jgi:SAM-dependent methyltransferase
VANEEQKEHWNSEEASHWVAHQLRYDTMLTPFGDRLLGAAQISRSDRVLDVGCGCGATTLAAGRRAVTGKATGLDLSKSMLAVGRHHASDEHLDNVSFVAGDAQTYKFPDGGFDVAISRFGVMFFDDPEAAFLNVAGALAPGGRLAFVCWQDLLSNPFIAVPGLAIAEHIALPDLGPPGAPGMFALADPVRIQSLVSGAGLVEVVIEPLAEEILLGGGGTLAEAVEFLRHGGMGRAVLGGADEATQDRAVTAVRHALAPYVTDEGVRIGTAAWLVTARHP